MNVRSVMSGLPTSLRRPIYLDHHATTPVDRRVADVMMAVLIEKFGNPNDHGHAYGEEAAEIVENARSKVGSLVDASAENVAFLRSTTAAVDKLISRLVECRPRGRPLRVIATTVEHHAVLSTLDRHRRAGTVDVEFLGVDGSARLNMSTAASKIERGFDLLCVMAANNEVGTLYPIQELAKLARFSGTAILVDASQAAATIPLKIEAWDVTYMVLSAHKMYGPKGVAAVVAKSGAGEILKDIEAGEGTPNVPAIAGIGEACRICLLEMAGDDRRIAVLRDRLERLLCSDLEGVSVNGDKASRLSHNLHISIPDVPNGAVVARLSRLVALSTGSACRWGTDEPSHVLRAMNLSEQEIGGALRMGLGRTTSEDDIEQAAKHITAAVRDIRRAMKDGRI